jgi:O-antigen/teichoic acid export membrane protein
MFSFLKRFDTAKIYSILAQVAALGVGYIAQLILFVILTEKEAFSHFQLTNFTTNLLGLFAGSVIPVLFSTRISAMTETEAKKTLSQTISPYMIVLLAQTAIMYVIFVGLNLSQGIDSYRLLLFLVSCLQVFAFSVMNLFHMYFIGRHDFRTFALFYILYGMIKSLFVLSAAFMFDSAEAIVLGITLASIVHSIIIATYLKVRPQLTLSFEALRSYKSRFIDQLIANLVMFGLLNISFIVAYFKIRADYNTFNLITLAQPVGLIPYYIVSSLGNVYMIDFAKGSKKASDIAKIVARMFVLLVAFSILTLIAGAVIFTIFNRAPVGVLLQYVMLMFPSTMAISLISVLLSIYQGLGELSRLRAIVLVLIPLYLFISMLPVTTEQLVLITGGIYFVISIFITLLSRTISWKS